MREGIGRRIREVQVRIADAAVRSGRDPGEITLVAVTKTVPVVEIQAAYDEGLRDFGENRVQEALPKVESMPSDIRWHLIGRLQTNKINKVLGRFGLIHSVDSIDLARGISQRSTGCVQDILLEVNTSGEGTKAGVGIGEAIRQAQEIARLPGLVLRGLMTVGPQTEDAGVRREAFRRLQDLYGEIRSSGYAGGSFNILSMGMSSDYEDAVAMGSTHVRVGTALFGERA